MYRYRRNVGGHRRKLENYKLLIIFIKSVCKGSSLSPSFTKMYWNHTTQLERKCRQYILLKKDNIMTLMNRLGNSKNQFQTDVKKVLTICSAGLLRAPTTAKVLAERYGYNTRAAGIEDNFALIKVDFVLIHWADELVFMEHEHLELFNDKFSDNTLAMNMIKDNEYQVLNLPDNFKWNDSELVDFIKAIYLPDHVK